MPDSPVKCGVILQKGLRDDWALKRKCLRYFRCFKWARKNTCSSAGSHCTRQPRHPAAAALLLSSAWLQKGFFSLVNFLTIFNLFNFLRFFYFNFSWLHALLHLSMDSRVAVTPLLIVGDSLSPALVTQPRSACNLGWEIFNGRLFLLWQCWHQ